MSLQTVSDINRLSDSLKPGVGQLRFRTYATNGKMFCLCFLLAQTREMELHSKKTGVFSFVEQGLISLQAA
ncbi:hypothetical protein A343_0901 [Porphyromonas gingivalis JCVI SC001]|nr:hypothetical protein A343_0901 [Porphyromonas gingivalis JCVI SC001]